MPSAPILDQGMPVEVMKDFDTVLLFGRLTKASPAALTIGHIPGGENFPCCQAGGTVLVRGYDSWMAPVLLRAKVIRSSGLECVVGNLEPIPYKTHRKRARYPLCPPVDAYVLEDAQQSQPQLCQLLNISTGGACIVAKHTYTVGQVFCLRVKLSGADQLASYRCKVVRATPRRGGCFEYGLLFVHLGGDQHRHLAQEIQMVQEEMEKKLLFESDSF